MSGRGAAVPGPTRTRVKNELHAIGLRKWPYIPLDRIFWALRKNGLIPLQEDGTPWSGMLMGAKECGPDAIDQQAHFPLAIMSDNDTGNWSMTNAGVHLSWCLLNTNPRSYEIVVYMG